MEYTQEQIQAASEAEAAIEQQVLLDYRLRRIVTLRLELERLKADTKDAPPTEGE